MIWWVLWLVGVLKALEEGDIGALKDYGKACFTKQVKCCILRSGCNRERRKEEKTKYELTWGKMLNCNFKKLGMISQELHKSKQKILK